MQGQDIDYTYEPHCKICQSPERKFIEIWRYALKRQFKQIIDFTDTQTNFGLFLNMANLSTHFSKHTSERAFWKEYPELMILKEKLL
jgi:hypothetical protein